MIVLGFFKVMIVLFDCVVCIVCEDFLGVLFELNKCVNLFLWGVSMILLWSSLKRVFGLFLNDVSVFVFKISGCFI